jgi:hypothetical protein
VSGGDGLGLVEAAAVLGVEVVPELNPFAHTMHLIERLPELRFPDGHDLAAVQRQPRNTWTILNVADGARYRWLRAAAAPVGLSV